MKSKKTLILSILSIIFGVFGLLFSLFKLGIIFSILGILLGVSQILLDKNCRIPTVIGIVISTIGLFFSFAFFNISDTSLPEPSKVVIASEFSHDDYVYLTKRILSNYQDDFIGVDHTENVGAILSYTLNTSEDGWYVYTYDDYTEINIYNNEFNFDLSGTKGYKNPYEGAINIDVTINSNVDYTVHYLSVRNVVAYDDGTIE